MNECFYNTRVRKAMSQKYRDIVNEIALIDRKLCDTYTLFKNSDPSMITFAKYKELERNIKELESHLERLKIKREVWDEAREICMNIEDEMRKEK